MLQIFKKRKEKQSYIVFSREKRVLKIYLELILGVEPMATTMLTLISTTRPS